MTGLGADRRFATELVFFWMSLHAGEVDLIDFSACELRLDQAREMARARDDDHTRRIRVETMTRPRLLWAIQCLEYVVQCVSVEPPGGVHRQRRGLVHDDQRFVLMHDLDLHVDVRLDHAWELVKVAFASVHDLARSGG